MQADRLRKIRDHIAGQTGHVNIQAADLCAMVDVGGIKASDSAIAAGLAKTAKTLRGHVGFVELPVEFVTYALDRAEKAPAVAAQQREAEAKSKAEAEEKARLDATKGGGKK